VALGEGRDGLDGGDQREHENGRVPWPGPTPVNAPAAASAPRVRAPTRTATRRRSEGGGRVRVVAQKTQVVEVTVRIVPGEAWGSRLNLARVRAPPVKARANADDPPGALVVLTGPPAGHG
jgi:hypothetical protein